ncbi:restriction endonuclease subunit S [Anabaena sp. CS-542/02]|uniref:restriction endonuclease subunit S n=1 Tax=Anabaena sp. CS-542/02 TaxID=3021719 RepID=UPI002330BBBB|nr:restriction endonuclease subunit S [Anabaena sp. CS-542/02]MDB9446547.1 restriction endonuclease subunit S [Anabaena sp. CS-542/02]
MGIKPVDWKIYTIDDLKANSNNAIAIGPFGSRMKSDCYVASGVPVIRGNNISNTKSFTGDFVFITEQKANELYSSNVVENDLVFPHRGAIGEVGIVPQNEAKRFVISSSLMKLTCNQSFVTPLFLFYFFRTPQGKYELLKNVSTVGTPGIATPLTSLKSITVPLPPLPEQKAIAHILGTLDDKIELNKQMNETLEAIARAIFKSWFVNFDPVRAKMEGKQPPGMDAVTADLFPDEFEESSLGLIPKGWRVGTIETECKLIMGQSPKSEFYNTTGDGLPFHQGVTNFGVRFPTHKIFCSLSQRIANLGDILFSVRAPVGRINIANENLIIGRGLAAIRHNQDFQSFLLYHLTHTFKEEDCIGTGTIFASVTRKELQEIKLIAPTDLIVKVFDAQIKSIDNIIAKNEQQSHTLATIRDSLLPKLMSGEVRVKEAEKIINNNIQ